MSVEDFYMELKCEDKNNEKIINLAKSIKLSDKYRNVDPLTLVIFYKHKEAFNILLDRGININQKKYIDIPPILWALEIEDTYYFKKLINFKNIDLFFKSNKRGENIVSNMCLKLHDMNLFKSVFEILRTQNQEKTKELIKKYVCLKNLNSLNSLTICLKYLEDNKEFYISKDLEVITLKKISIILENSNKIKDILDFKYNSFLKYLFEESKLCYTNLNFVEKLFDYLMKFEDFTDFIQSYSLYFKMSIKYNIRNLFNYKLNLYNYKDWEVPVSDAIIYNNTEIAILLIELGYKYNDFESFNNVIKNDNLIIFKKLLENTNFQGIYKKSYNIIPKNHRFIHKAILNGSCKIFKYLTTEYGDDLNYKGVCIISPKQLLDKCYNEIIRYLDNSKDYKKSEIEKYIQKLI